MPSALIEWNEFENSVNDEMIENEELKIAKKYIQVFVIALNNVNACDDNMRYIGNVNSKNKKSKNNFKLLNNILKNV